MIDPQKAVSFMRKKNPTLSWLSDEHLYSLAQEKYPEYDYPDNPFLPDYSKTPTPNKDKNLNEFKTSPKEVNKLWSSFNLADYFSEDGVPSLGLSPEMFKNASNENIVGLTHLLTTGNLKHEVEDYDPKFRESVAEFFIGLANPVDAMAFFGSSGVGAFVGKPLLKKALSKKFFQEAVEGSVRKKLVTSPTAYGVAESFTTGTIGLGSYMAGAGALSEASKQSMEMKNPEGAYNRYGPEVFSDGSVNHNPYIKRNEGEWDYKNILSEGAKFGLEGMVLGGLTAGTGKAIGSKFSTMGGKATSKAGQTATKLLNYPTQTAVEAGEFAFTPYLWNGMPKKDDGSADWDQMAHDYGHSVGVIGPLKASNAFFKSSHSDIKEHMAHAKQLFEIRKGYKTKEKQALDNVKLNIEQNTEVGEKKSSASIDVDKAIDSAINKESKTISDLIETYSEMDKFLSRTVENLDKENLSPQQLRDVLNDAPISVNLLDGWIKHMRNLEKENPSLYNELTDNGRLKIRDKIIGDAEKIRDAYNEKVSQPKNADKEIIKDTDKEIIKDTDKEIIVESDKEIIVEDAPKILWNKKQLQQINKKLKDVGLEYETDLTQFDLNTPEGLKEAIKVVNERVEKSKELPSNPQLEEILKLTKKTEKRTRIQPETVMHPDDFIKEKRKSENISSEAKNKLNTSQSKKDLKNITEAQEVALKNYTNEQYTKSKDKAAAEKKVTGAIKFVKYLNDNNVNLDTMIALDFQKWHDSIGIATGNSPKSNIQQAAMNYITHLNARGYISGPKFAELQAVYSQYKSIVNDMRDGAPIAKKGIRKNALNEIIKLSEEGKISDAYAGMLVTDYMLRSEEVGKLRGNHIKKEGKDYYIDMDKTVRKGSTFDRIVYLEREFGEALKSYLDKGNKLNTTEFNRVMQKHSNSWTIAKERGKTSAGAGPAFEIRRRGHTLADDKLSGPLYRQYLYLQGHGKTAIEKIYGSRRVSKIIKHQKDIRKQMGIEGYDAKKGTFGEKSTFKFQLEPIGEASMDASVKAIIKNLSKRNPGLKVAFEKDKAYAGKFLKDVIYLTEGKANLQTFFHENGHRFEAFIRDSKNKDMVKLWERGEKMFAKDAKKAGQSANEYFTDRVSDYGVGMSLGVRNKISNWSKLMMTKIKKFFFGKDNLNKRDIARLLGQKVYKGFGTENTILLGEKPKFQIRDAKKFSKHIKETFDSAMEKYIKNSDKLSSEALKAEKNEMIRFIAEKSGMENPEKFTSISSKHNVEQLESFYQYLVSPEMFKIKEKTELSKFLKAKDNATNLRTSLNISFDKEKKILKHLGIKDGDIYNASSQQVKEYITFMDNSGLSKHVPKKDWIQEAIGDGIISESDIAKFTNISEIKGVSLPVQYIIKSLGLKPLADRLLSHQVQEMSHIGRAQRFENNMSTILQTQGMKTSEKDIGIFKLASGRKKFEKIQDMLYLFDEGRRIERVKNNYLTKAEQKFVNQAFEKNGLGGVKKGSIAEALKKEIDKYNEYIRIELEASVKANMNDAQFQEWKKSHNPKWVVEREGNSYVHRGLTKEFFEAYRPDSQAFERRIEKEGIKIAKKMAKEKNPGATESEIKRAADKLLPEAEEMARAKFANSYEFSGSKFNTEFLMERNRDKLPERWFSEKLGKEIDVYDTSYDRVFKKYQLGMGKALANIEYFPEHVNLKGVVSNDTKKSIQSLENSHGKWGRYVKDIVERQLNIGKHEGVFENMSGGLRTYANFLARTQLSFPTAGLKNALIGTYQSLYAFKMREMAGGFLSSMDKRHRALVRRQGGTEIGLKHIDTYDGVFKGLVDKGFKFGLMRPTENLNRYASVGAAHIDQAGLLKTLRRYDPTSRKHKKAYNRLNKFYELKENEIKKLNKYGLGGVDGLKMEAIERRQLSRELNQIYNKMDAMAHIKTQGATLDLFMPYWMGSGNIKALTLFKRMAYTASVNTVANVKAAFTEGNPMKVAVGTMGMLASGEVMMTVYDKILGQGRPAEDSPFWDKFTALAHRGEFLGIFSEWWNYNNEHPFEHTISPAIYNHAYDMLGFWSDYANKERFLSDTIDRSLRGTVSAYNSTMKILERNMSLEYTDGKIKTKSQWFNKAQKDFSMKYGEFLELIDPNAKPQSSDYSRDVQTKYFERLKQAFNSGDDKLFTKTYLAAFWSVYGDESQKGKDYLGQGTYTDKQALKRAYGRMKKYSRYLNPNKGSFIKEIFGLKSNLETKQMYAQWMKHLHPDKTFKDFKMVNGKIIPFIGPNTSKNQERLIKAEVEFWSRYSKLFDENGMLKKELITKHFGKDSLID